MPRHLIYFSSCAIHPDGSNDPFMTMEQPWLCSHFDSVMMAAYQGADWLDENTQAEHSPKKPPLCAVRAFFRALLSKDVRTEWQRMRADGCFSPVNALKVLMFAVRGQRMYLAARTLMPKDWQPSGTTLYSCWMSFDAYAAALLKRAFPEMRFVARGHAFDIDVERNPLNPYLMKQAIADAADRLHPICNMAREQMMSYLQGRVAEEKVQVLPFGSAGEQPAELLPPPLHTEGVLRIVSCAKVIPIKQVNVLLEALARWEGVPVHWTHIGDGEELPELQRRAEELLDPKENVIVSWLGNLPADQVLALYENQPFDVIINTSRKEGVPVSIMEAMRCGLVAIAPAVGGLPELITPDTGWLYDPQEGETGVLRCLETLAAENREKALIRRENAARRWAEQFRNSSTLERMLAEVK